MSSERFQYVRRRRTNFSPEQLRTLKDAFKKTRLPDWETIQELALMLRLDEIVVKTWFKNQRVKWKKQQQTQASQSPGPSSQNKPATGQQEEEDEKETPLPINAAGADSPSSGGADHQSHDPQEPPGVQQPGEAGASVSNSSGGSEPYDIQQICLGDLEPPWASIPYDMDQFIKLYFLPGDDDPSSLDRYLFPGCLD